ncbi:MAG: glycosyl transferase family 41 [Selenomonadaceae bacterium]|nr:glycosyl transferase family 41 [Selenomonadaceae bacterium]
MDLAKKFLAENLPDKALERLKKILPTVNPSDEWKVHELIGAAFHDLCDAEGAVQASLNAAKTDLILRTQRRHFSNYIFALHYLNVDAEILFDAAKIYNSLYRDAEQNYSLLTTHYSLKTINVAFVAPHFLDSSSARFYEPLLTLYDREKFFVTAWSLSNDEDDFTKKIRRSVDGYFDVSEISFEETAQKIHDVGADILFDLGGHTEGGATLQIAAYKPARVQISGIGYFDTTGLDAIDFYLTDKFLIDGSKNFFTENILTLESAFAFKPNKKMARAKEIFLRTPHKNFTFGCLNNFMKITDEYLNCVKKILAAVPNAKIIFRDTTPLKSRQVALTEKIKSAGLPINRVEIFCGRNEFFDDYAQIDLMLDTFPYTGGMMTALAIYFGVPVLNLCGKIHSQRLGAEMLQLAGLENFIVTNADDYINFAVNFTKNPTKISPAAQLFDVENFVANFYAALEGTINFD